MLIITMIIIIIHGWMAFGFIVLFTTLVFYISLDWYFWCVVKKVYNDTKNNQDMLLPETEHEGIELQTI